MTGIELRRAGRAAWLVELPDNAHVAHAARRLRATFGARLADVVPGHRTVLAVGAVGGDELRAAVKAALADPAGAAPGRSHVIPVVYDGPDLGEVARLTGLSPEEVVGRHCASLYTVAFLGFAPGFGYLIGGDPSLHVPRRDDPRERVPAGSVAVAGVYSGVYPRESPGGWRLLGRTDARLFDPDRDAPALLAPGDAVRFAARR